MKQLPPRPFGAEVRALGAGPLGPLAREHYLQFARGAVVEELVPAFWRAVAAGCGGGAGRGAGGSAEHDAALESALAALAAGIGLREVGGLSRCRRLLSLSALPRLARASQHAKPNSLPCGFAGAIG